MRRIAWLVVVLVCVALACNGTTGDQLLTFPAFASGVPGALQPFIVNGYSVQLTTAKMHIGAVYVNESPIGTTAETPVCINPGIYAAQVPGPIDVDLLNPMPQPWVCSPPNCMPASAPQQGSGTMDLGQSWELWLSDETPGGQSDSIDNTNFDHIVDLQGIATRLSDSQQFPFAAIVTINATNRGIATTDPAQPGLNPICKQRIVLIGGIALTFFGGGALNVTIDPRVWFALESQLDFASLPLTTDTPCSSSSAPYGDEAIPIDPLFDYGPAVCEATLTNGICPPNTGLNPADVQDPIASRARCRSAASRTRTTRPEPSVPSLRGSTRDIVSGGAAYAISFLPPPLPDETHTLLLRNLTEHC